MGIDDTQTYGLLCGYLTHRRLEPQKRVFMTHRRPGQTWVFLTQRCIRDDMGIYDTQASWADMGISDTQTSWADMGISDTEMYWGDMGIYDTQTYLCRHG